MLKLLLVFLLASVAVAKKALVSVFSDGGVGAGGTYLGMYPTKITVNGRRLPVYAAAVHSSMVSAYKYKVLRIRHGSKTGYVHIVDECASGSCHTNHAKARRKGGLLIDVHQKAMRHLGLKWTLQDASFTTVGKVSLNKIPGYIVSGEAKRGYLERKWKN